MPVFEDNKFIVIPTKYLAQLAITNRVNLERLLDRIENLRLADRKDPNPRYYVCNVDEPYAREVHDAILKGEKLKEKNR